MTAATDRDERPPRSLAEWVTFAVALTLVASIVGAILLSWATGASGPPVLGAERDGPIVRDGAVYRVPFEVRNTGGETATSVQVVAELTIDGSIEGSGEQSFMFLSGGESESGEFLFAKDPAAGELTIEVASYANP
jgi:uncharacterized protein (TIGR02588 family)